MKNIIVIAGATASGKTRLAIEIAKRIPSEIVSADSMQVYKGMDIGTAKPTEEEKEGIVHHMLSVVEPSEGYSVMDFVSGAKKAIDEITGKGKVPVVVGGTGMYLDVLTGRMSLDAPKSDDAIRRELTEIYEKEGLDALYDIFLAEAGDASGKIHKNDVKRVMRAIEKARSGFSQCDKKEENMSGKEYNSLWFAIDIDRESLYNRINRRVDMMLDAGLIEEVKRVIVPVREKCTTSLAGIGYKEVLSYLDGVIGYDEMVESIKKGSRNYAKRQLTWFRRNSDIIWLDAVNSLERALKIIEERNVSNENSN